MSSSTIIKNNSWHQQIFSALAEINVECQFFFEGDFALLSMVEHGFIIHLVNIKNCFQPAELLVLQSDFANKGKKIINLWEDVWLLKRDQVISRISSLLGFNKRIHGRKTKVKKLAKPIAQSFLDNNHLQGYVSSRYKLGLFEKEELVAVATFSALRKMNFEENYKSAELIRFAVKSGYSVTGGLSKLVNYFHEQYTPNDLMTYADRDWSAGEAYLKLKFINTAVLLPQYFVLDENFNRLLMLENPLNKQKVFNTGSLKYILKF